MVTWDSWVGVTPVLMCQDSVQEAPCSPRRDSTSDRDGQTVGWALGISAGFEQEPSTSRMFILGTLWHQTFF